MWILSYTHLLFSTHDALHRSFDQYFNIVLEDAVERVMHENVYADKELGVQVIRGDSVSLMGECVRSAQHSPTLTHVATTCICIPISCSLKLGSLKTCCSSFGSTHI